MKPERLLLAILAIIDRSWLSAKKIESGGLDTVGHIVDVNVFPYLPAASTLSSICSRAELIAAFILLSAALVRALLRDASTIDASIPIIAMTIRTSIRVNPLE